MGKVKFDILYHGTNRAYHDEKVKRCGRYEHGGLYRICLDDHPLTAIGYAMQRAEFYKSEPIVLVVDVSRVTSNLSCTPTEMECDYLEPEWYRMLEVELKKGTPTPATFDRLKQLVPEIQLMPDNPFQQTHDFSVRTNRSRRENMDPELKAILDKVLEDNVHKEGREAESDAGRQVRRYLVEWGYSKKIIPAYNDIVLFGKLYSAALDHLRKS